MKNYMFPLTVARVRAVTQLRKLNALTFQTTCNYYRLSRLLVTITVTSSRSNGLYSQKDFPDYAYNDYAKTRLKLRSMNQARLFVAALT